ncbi:hypothetical protein [Kaistella sp.]|uniref:hypothetical protein n=1 Tax=Kaistella sp. TaxID=2782235 RepID=UPI003C52AB12
MNIQEILGTPIVNGNQSLSWLNGGVVLSAVIGAAALYFMIPERKRKNLLK